MAMGSSKLSAILFILLLSTPQILACPTCGPKPKPKPKPLPPGKPPITLPPVPVIGKPPVTLPPIIGKPPITLPPVPVIGKPPVTLPPVPVIGKPPITLPPVPVIGKPPITLPPVPVIGKPPVTLPPVPVIGKPPITLPPVLGPIVGTLPPVPVVTPVLPPVIGGATPPAPIGCPPGSTSPPSGGGAETCPLDTLKLGACVAILGAAEVHLGDPAANQCCSVISGLVDLEAAICLCTTIKLGLLNINLVLPVAVELLAACGKNPPPGFTCPT